MTGCTGQQSALDPAGLEAEQIASLFWWMTGGAVVIWLAVLALAAYAVRSRQSEDPTHQSRRSKWMIIGGGAVIPTFILAGLLLYGLALLPKLVAQAPPGTLRIAVTGEQWWWRVQYHPGGSGEVVLANEIRIPVGEPVEFLLNSPDVIHSFWIPSLGGKVDMLPGRETRLVLTPTRTGVFRGVCAEFCGASHAYMAFYVEVMEPDDFARWLEQQREPAAEPVDTLALRGAEQFLANGCSACHAIRGTEADGVIGPDLTHVGSRMSLGAGIIANDEDGFLRWIERTNLVKPGVLMPHFGMLPEQELSELAAYLESLQ